MERMPPQDKVAARLHQALSSHQAGRFEEALAGYRQVLAAEPANFDALCGAGMLFAQQGRLDEALRYFTQACAARPDDFGVHFNRGAALYHLGRYDRALEGYQRAVALQPDFVEALLGRGNALKELHRLDEALASYDEVIALAPASLQAAQAFNNRGVILELLQRDHEALASYDRAIALHPAFAKAYNTRGVLLEKLGRKGEALISYEKAVALDGSVAEPHFNRGNLLRGMNRWDEALAEYDRAVALNPVFAEAHNNRAILLALLHRYDEALAAYDRALAAKPDYAAAHYNKSLVLLLLGDYAAGWPFYEWRWKSELKEVAFRFAEPQWLGHRPLARRTLLLHCEQGMGDAIQMVRYTPMIEALGARVVLVLPNELISLFRTLNGNFTIVERGGSLPSFDFYCPMMSLPLAFGTTVDSIPASIPYLYSDPRRRAAWRQRLGTRGKGRIGLAWSGNPANKIDRHRSLPLRNLAPLLSLGFEFHSLQKQISPGDREVLSEFPQLTSHENELTDFADTAALIDELDLVIAVDTAVAHLAGALGKKAWILLAYDPDFRWMINRPDSPWYPNARLFRQSRRDDWDQVVEEVFFALVAEMTLQGSSKPA